MLFKEELYSNINTEFGISKEYLKESRYGLCHYINDLCIAINVPTEVASIAMYLTNYFFVKKCYFNYEKLTLACAAILLSAKEQNSQNKFNEISKEYIKFNSKIFGQINSVLRSEDNQKIKDKISTYEITLLKALQFDLKFSLPFDYIYVYSSILYPNNEDDIIWTSRCITHDSYFTYAPNVYPNYIVAIASIIIAAKFLMIPTPIDDEFKNLSNMKFFHSKGKTQEEFEKALMDWENRAYYHASLDQKPIMRADNTNSNTDDTIDEENAYFTNLSIAQKLFPNMTIQDLIDCIEMIVEFYQDAKRLVSNKTSETENNENNKK